MARTHTQATLQSRAVFRVGGCSRLAAPPACGQLGRTHNADVFARRFEPASTPALTAERPHGVAPPAGNVAVVTMHLETGRGPDRDRHLRRSPICHDRGPASGRPAVRCAARRTEHGDETRDGPRAARRGRGGTGTARRERPDAMPDRRGGVKYEMITKRNTEADSDTPCSVQRTVP